MVSDKLIRIDPLSFDGTHLESHALVSPHLLLCYLVIPCRCDSLSKLSGVVIRIARVTIVAGDRALWDVRRLTPPIPIIEILNAVDDEVIPVCLTGCPTDQVVKAHSTERIG